MQKRTGKVLAIGNTPTSEMEGNGETHCRVFFSLLGTQ